MCVSPNKLNWAVQVCSLLNVTVFSEAWLNLSVRYEKVFLVVTSTTIKRCVHTDTAMASPIKQLFNHIIIQTGFIIKRI